MPYKPQPTISPFQRHKAKWIDCQRCSLCERRKHVVLVRGKIPAPVLFIGEAPGASEDVLGRPFVGPAGKLLDHIIEKGIDGQYDYAITNLVGCIPKPSPPRVVNMKREECDVRIDRKSEWGNPFLIGKDGNRLEVIARYAEWLPTQAKLMRKLPSLSGKRLGCHCSPQPCHGDVIVALYKQEVGTGKVAEPPEEAINACAPRVQELIKLVRPQLLVYVGKLAAQYAASYLLPVPRRREIEIIHPAAILRMDISQQGLAVQRCIVALEDAIADL